MESKKISGFTREKVDKDGKKIKKPSPWRKQHEALVEAFGADPARRTKTQKILYKIVIEQHLLTPYEDNLISARGQAAKIEKILRKYHYG